ncbi:aspartic proteinase nepenthesin-2-like [Castanea sativa]|uniref:aspartic proteinase nepenthesin-2-like n=1 Tax=Castanea sativa TaxID=21020 RepID=UPI003F6534C5
MGTRNLFDVPIVFFFLLTLLIFVLACPGTNGFSIKLIPRYSIDSMLFPKNLSLLENHFKSMSFVDAINSTKQGNKALQPKIEYAFGNAYVAQMKIGTPPYSALLLVDTGSDDTWVQGEGCKNCFHVRDGNFNYHMSGTYHRLSCDDPLCVPKICEENFCRYEISYYDGTYSAGPISTETFTFTMDGGGSIDYHNLVFGVGLDNQNIVFAQELGSRNIASGIFGLGVGKRSFLRQLEADTDLRFSYCFPTNHEPGIYTYLRFGKDATISGNDLGIVQTTPIIPGQDRYYVQVLKISMNGKDLPIDKVDFQLRSDSRGGFVIASGTSQTFLVESAYKVVRDEIVSFLQAHNLNPMPRSDSTLEICYKDVQETENLPSLTIHFLGAKLKLESSRIFAYDANHNLCMFIQPSPQQGLNILGAFQQKDHRFLIDVKTSTMYFVPENCHNN